MKSAMPYRGVPSPALKRPLAPAVRGSSADARPTVWQAVALDLWRDAAWREERYAAIALTDLPRYAIYRTPEALPMLEEMIVTGAWWDWSTRWPRITSATSCAATPRRVGPADAPLGARRMTCGSGAPPSSVRFASRPTPISICSTPASSRTCADREFFIRKAIGWALRQHAWVDPGEVARYVRANRDPPEPAEHARGAEERGR